jgi:hypothetical protein
MQRIELALAQLFRCHRIVFWYDVKNQIFKTSWEQLNG